MEVSMLETSTCLLFPLCLPGTDSLTDPSGRRQAVGEISRGCVQPNVKDGKCPPPMMKQAGQSASPGQVSASKPHPHPQTPKENPILKLEQPANYLYVSTAFHRKDIKANQQKKT